MKNGVKTVENLGTVNLSQIELMDEIEIYIGICDLSDELKEYVTEAVERDKPLHMERDREYVKRYGQHWSDAGVKITPQLHICLSANEPIYYRLYVFYEDLEDDDLCSSVALEVDLSAHMKELKEVIVRALVDKFA